LMSLVNFHKTLATRQQLGWRQDNGNRSNQESKFDFLATRQQLAKIDRGQQKIKIVRTNRQSNLRGSCQSILPLCRHHPIKLVRANKNQDSKTRIVIFCGNQFAHQSHMFLLKMRAQQRHQQGGAAASPTPATTTTTTIPTEGQMCLARLKAQVEAKELWEGEGEEKADGGKVNPFEEWQQHQYKSHMLSHGDTLASIAIRYQMDLQELLQVLLTRPTPARTHHHHHHHHLTDEGTNAGQQTESMESGEDWTHPLCPLLPTRWFLPPPPSSPCPSSVVLLCPARQR